MKDLPCTISRKKWQKRHEDMKENNVVLIPDPDTPRGKRSFGRVLELFYGADGRVRVVSSTKFNLEIGG